MSTPEPGGCLPLPDGALMVKDNFASPTANTPMVVTIMAKQQGTWYWIEATPDGKVVLGPDGKTPLEGTAVQGCISCHSGQASNDDVFTHDFTK